MSVFTYAAGIGLPWLLAYVGPGPGLSMMWALVGLFVTVLAAFSAIALWPLRVFMRRLRGRTNSSEPTESAQS